MSLDDMRKFVSNSSAGGENRKAILAVMKEAIFKHNKFANSAPLNGYKSIKQEAYNW